MNVLKLFFYPFVDFKALKSALQKQFITHNFTVLKVAHLVIGSNQSNNFMPTLIGEVSHLHFVLRFESSFIRQSLNSNCTFWVDFQYFGSYNSHQLHQLP